jgi:hypothetical protein
MKTKLQRPVLLFVLLGVAIAIVPAVTMALAEESTSTVIVEAPVVTTSVTQSYPDLPQEMKDLMAQGMTMAEAAHAIDPGPPVGTRIDMGGGRYIVRLPDTIPVGRVVEPVVIPPHTPETDDPTDYSPPQYLYPREVPLYRELMVSGEGFRVVQGNDGYMHVVR